MNVLGSQLETFQSHKAQRLFKMCAICQALITLQIDKGFFMVSIQKETILWNYFKPY